MDEYKNETGVSETKRICETNKIDTYVSSNPEIREPKSSIIKTHAFKKKDIHVSNSSNKILAYESNEILDFESNKIETDVSNMIENGVLNKIG